MNWLKRILAYFFPSLGPKSTWTQARIVTATAYHTVLYNDLVQRIKAVRPLAIIAPVMLVTIRVHPGFFPKPDENGWGKVLTREVLGDPFGTIVVRHDFAQSAPVWQHEMGHAITGISDHPSWLYKEDGFTLNV